MNSMSRSPYVAHIAGGGGGGGGLVELQATPSCPLTNDVPAARKSNRCYGLIDACRFIERFEVEDHMRFAADNGQTEVGPGRGNLKRVDQPLGEAQNLPEILGANVGRTVQEKANVRFGSAN